MPYATIHSVDRADYLVVHEAGDDGPTGAVSYISHAQNGYYDREATVRLIETLTAAVEIHDAAEAKKAAKLKEGDKVVGASRRFLLLVIRDEDEDGYVDLVKLQTGEILKRRSASSFTRRASAGGYVPRVEAPF